MCNKKIRSIIFIIFVSLIFTQCYNDKIKQKKIEKIDILIVDTTNLSSKKNKTEEIKRTIIEKRIVDFDNNEVYDTLIMEKDDASTYFTAIINSKKYNYESPSVFYDTIKIEKIQNHNLIKSNFFVVFKNSENKNFLYIKDRGDFMGPVNFIYGYKNNIFLELLNIEGEEPIEIISDSISTYLVLKEISYEPEIKKGYCIIEYPRFKLYKIKNEKIKFDSLASINYNIKNNKDFEKYLEMKIPVLGQKEGTNNKFELIDLDKIK